MTKKQLAKIIIKSYDFTERSQFDRILEYLKTVLFHTMNNADVQNAIWYLEDKKHQRNFSK